MFSMANARKIALDALVAVGKDYGYSNLVLQKTLAENNVSGIDKPFITALFYGVLDRVITLDFVISKFISKPLQKITPITLFSLRLAVFQILYMNKVPHSAAVNESVKLVKCSKEKFNAGFVNAVLRNFLRQGVEFPSDDLVNSLKIRYSCPEWIIENFIGDYGKKTAVSILEHFLTVPKIAVRVNTTLISDDVLISNLKNSGVDAKLCEIPHCVVFGDGVDIKSLDAYKNGYFHPQDLPSQIAVSKLMIKPGERVLDMCASPGGKTFTAAQNGENSAQIIACDFYEKRVSLITNGAKRLKLKNISGRVCNSTVFDENLGQFDAVICDVPCSGLGVVRRKPEIKYKTDLDLKKLCETQTAIIENGVKYLKPGGRLLYSTCTLRRAENEFIVRACLDKHPSLALEYEHTFLPNSDKTDGFYCAILRNR